ncbi:putative molybdopterin binding domain protein [Roseivivax sp. THAF40]|uniref:molybdopterin-binding protein n=1 Tax=unclassified Roseivivax TaxID=2639302 RepID=UPI0012696D67|nr:MULTISPECIES: molybdopterin-binding protein [unclassified Roseivivax]QFS82213.1 putative molybdopterin binding domain protein [Roseivivax sp. THAF197b]QFT46013.1 putative molybdopterin binding domain protein [Roseivivax sp. THAF40]
MKFGPMPVSEAEGAILAHSVALPKGRLKKGMVIDAEAVAKLEAAGLSEVVAARLEPGDLGEDDAAAELARALVPGEQTGLRIGRAATGRANVFAEGPGLAHIDADRINALNAVHPMITVATVPPFQRMAAGGMVATIKIISYGVPGAALAEAASVGAGALGFHAPAIATAQLIQTSTESAVDPAKGHKAIADRLDRLGVDLAPAQVVPHEVDALAAALRASEAEALFILTGSATSDLHDTAPEALRAAGGQVAHYGMPVDPGNLLFLGDLGGRPVVGLPGCARSPALNGADWVMERILCGVAVTPADIAGMGVGGLLKEIPLRGRPREA